MRAVIRRGTSLICEDMADPKPGMGEVLVKTLACGICGSDLHALHYLDHMMDMTRRAGGNATVDPAKDMVMGHEFSAEILDHGPGTQGTLKAGTRVVSFPAAITPTGAELIGYSNTYPGGFAERMVLQEALLLPIPNGLADDAAAMTEPFAVGEHAVAQAQIEPGSVCLVLGCGPVGLAVIASLKARGVGPVVAADYSPARRAMAERMGADKLVDPATASPHTAWADYGVPSTMAAHSMASFMGQVIAKPIVFECVGAPGVLQSVIEGCPPKSQIIVAGVCMEADRIEPSLAINKQLDLRFVFAYSPEEFGQTLHNIAEGVIDVTPVMTDHIGLDQVADAFKALAKPDQQVKVVVQPWKR
jgi:threonine dehydrogenase-like Zn-dependent dehydrogenase